MVEEYEGRTGARGGAFDRNAALDSLLWSPTDGVDNDSGTGNTPDD